MRRGKFVKTPSQTVSERTSYGRDYLPEDEVVDDISVYAFNGGGTNDRNPPTTLENHEFKLLRNADIVDNRILVRRGTGEVLPTRPDSNRILGLFSFRRAAGNLDYLRFTKVSVYKLFSGSWVAITGPALAGNDYDRFTSILVEDRIFFNNNGKDVLQEVDLSANTYAAAGNARKYKYYTVANNRIIGAYLTDTPNNPNEIAGSGDRNYDEWNPLVDISSFRNTLASGQGSYVDDITGIVGIGDNVLVLRSRSLWLGTPQPVASTPFVWQKIYSGIGCNAPYSVSIVKGGVVWYDPVSREVYHYSSIDNSVSVLSSKLQLLQSTVGDVSYLSSSYDEQANVYELCIEIGSSNTTIIYRYNFNSQSWSSYNLPKVTLVSNAVDLVASSSIDSLVGTIDGLSGTIDGLSTSSFVPRKIYGTNDGYRTEHLTTGMAGTGSDFGGNRFKLYISSKDFEIPGWRQIIKEASFDIIINSSGTMKVYAILDNSFVVKDFSLDGRLYKMPINRVCKTFSFRIEVGGVDLPLGSIREMFSYRVVRVASGRI